jgi:hypothetical protein
MPTPEDVQSYNDKQTAADQVICNWLAFTIEAALPEANGKVWHGHPVWFIDSNPVVGYHRQKDSVRILFWSGQSFNDDALKAIGSFKAAGVAIESVETFNPDAFAGWLEKCRRIQWDYAHLPKKKALEKLTAF